MWGAPALVVPEFLEPTTLTVWNIQPLCYLFYLDYYYCHSHLLCWTSFYFNCAARPLQFGCLHAVLSVLISLIPWCCAWYCFYNHYSSFILFQGILVVGKRIVQTSCWYAFSSMFKWILMPSSVFSHRTMHGILLLLCVFGPSLAVFDMCSFFLLWIICTLSSPVCSSLL